MMKDPKRSTPQKIVWVDMEMTGLTPTKDRIVEIAAIVTDWDFTELASWESGVRQDETELRSLYAANPFAQAIPGYVPQMMALAAKSPSEKDVEAQLLAFLDEHVSKDEPILLAGNSIHQDRSFIRVQLPHLEARLHYRMLDVSAWKVVMIGKYGVEFPKGESHRALEDIRESIAELTFYLQKLKGLQ